MAAGPRLTAASARIQNRRRAAIWKRFRAKEPMEHLVATIPVSVILNPEAALLGAAARAQYLSLVG